MERNPFLSNSSRQSHVYLFLPRWIRLPLPLEVECRRVGIIYPAFHTSKFPFSRHQPLGYSLANVTRWLLPQSLGSLSVPHGKKGRSIKWGASGTASSSSCSRRSGSAYVISIIYLYITSPHLSVSWILFSSLPHPQLLLRIGSTTVIYCHYHYI